MSDTPPTDTPWQQRALAAEQKAGELEGKLTTLSSTLEEAQQALVALDRTRRLDIELMHADAVDLEAARLLAEAALAADSTADIPKTVAALKQRKPFLFRPRRAPASAMSATSAPKDTLSEIADHARTTGDRRALLHYLRTKRGV